MRENVSGSVAGEGMASSTAFGGPLPVKRGGSWSASPTGALRFNTCRFADYEEKVIDLIARVILVSVETVAITQARHNARR
jgi:hypothetical protein